MEKEAVAAASWVGEWMLGANARRKASTLAALLLCVCVCVHCTCAWPASANAVECLKKGQKNAQWLGRAPLSQHNK